MKRYLNKALLYKEWKSVKWLSIMFLFQVSLQLIVPFINNVQYLKKSINRGEYKYSEYEYFFTSFFRNNRAEIEFTVITLIIIGTFIVGMDIMGRRYDTIGSMPFKREEIIITKWIVAALTTIIPIFLSFVIIKIMYLCNKDILSPYINGNIIEQWALINSLTYLFIISFIMFIQTLLGKNILGGIIGSIFLLLPLGLGVLIRGFTEIMTYNPEVFTRDGYNNFINEMDRFFSNISLGFYNNENIGFNLSIYKRELILAISIIIVLVLMVYSFKNLPFERIGYVVIYRPLELILKIGVSVCFGLVGGTIASGFISSYYELYRVVNSNNIKEYLPVIDKAISLTVLIALLCGCIVYVVTGKIIEANKK